MRKKESSSPHALLIRQIAINRNVRVEGNHDFPGWVTRSLSYWLPLAVVLGSLWSGGSVQAQSSRILAWGVGVEGQTNVPSGLTNVVAVAAGRSHNLVLNENGRVVGWGDNFSGQTNMLGPATGIIAIVSKAERNLALQGGGTLIASGTVWDGNSSVPATIPLELGEVIGVAAGLGHTLVLRSDGTVAAWGWNYFGQANVPAGLINVVAVAGGRGHSLALQADGRVIAWGDNQFGQASVPAGLTNALAVAAGDAFSLALRADGTVVAWGRSDRGQTNIPAGLAKVAAIAAGEYHGLALKADGTLAAWGQHRNGRTFLPVTLPEEATNVVAIAAGADHDLALVGGGRPVIESPLADREVARGGTVYLQAVASGARPLSFQWKRNGVDVPGATNSVLMLTDAQPADGGAYSLSVSNAFGGVTSRQALLNVVPLLITKSPLRHVGFVGENFTFAVEAQSSVPLSYQWQENGTDLPGATAPWLTLTNLSLSRTGTRYSVVLSNAYGMVETTPAELSVGHVAAWGQNHYGQAQVPEAMTNVIAVAAGYGYNVALKTDSTVMAWGYNKWGQSDVPAGLTNVVAIDADGYSAALRADGTVVVWGGVDYYTTNVPPMAVDVVAIACGGGNTLALRADGIVIAWGISYSPQMHPSTRLSVPSGLSNVVAIAGGDYHALALRSDGTVVAWGLGSFGETNIPPGLSNVVAIACGDYHSLALRLDGTVAAWGADWAVTSFSSRLSNVVALAGGYSHSVALHSDGSVVTWRGSYNFGQTNMPSGLRNVSAVAADDSHSLALVSVGASPEPPRIHIEQTGGTAILSFSGGSNGQLVIEFTDSLTPQFQWHFLRNLRLTANSTVRVDLGTTDFTKRFFRARLVP
jgi:alpha-tubulin suppressor-like RCC1 family protein